MVNIYDDAHLYEVNQLTQRYNGRDVLDIAQLQIRNGEILAIVGPSGAGKSTLLRLLAFLEPPAAGEISFGGRLVDSGWPDLAARREVSMVFQRPHLLRRSVAENVVYGLRLRGEKGGDARVSAVLHQLGLAHLAGASAQTLSGGEMQRVALARALVLQPRVLLMDEPTANLDPANIRLIEEMVQRSNSAEATTVVIITHNIFQARRLADRVALLLNGRLVELADTETFFESPARAETRQFVHGDMVY